MSFEKASFVEKLKESTKVNFLSSVHDCVLVLSRDTEFVSSLDGRPGVQVRWYDRTAWETLDGGTPRMQAEIIIAPKFFGEKGNHDS